MQLQLPDYHTITVTVMHLNHLNAPNKGCKTCIQVGL